MLIGSNNRHEYMGPSPCVATYRFTRNEAEVEFWEAHLEQTWIGKHLWRIEVEFDEVVQGWFLVDRGGGKL